MQRPNRTNELSLTPHVAARALQVSILFWALSYALFSFRSLLTDDPVLVFSGSRLVATGAGTIILWSVLLQLRPLPRSSSPGAAHLLTALALASLFLLAVRQVYDSVSADRVASINENGRWALAWLAYSAAFLAFYILHRNRHERAVRDSRVPSLKALDEALARPREEAIAWILAALAEEMTSESEDLAHELLARLAQRTGYEMGDPDAYAPDVLRDARIELLERLRRLILNRNEESG